ncbi:hypothetical protein EB796_014003 [Bugula neritina]|uniref:Uncharacterized protein n=1 Tax=Bugula neritina TaxID=10212 RepID=A0A7J7JPT4_BUGNE|nr:hypothetical protein EB796_014003 [Bugula neritina]
MMPSDDLPANTNAIHYENKHKLACINLCSNVSGYTQTVNFINSGNEYELVVKMMDFLTKLSEVCYHSLLVRHKDVFKQLTGVSLKKFKLVVITKQ